MFNLNEKYFSISERCGRNHQNKFCLRLPKRRFCTWELSRVKAEAPDTNPLQGPNMVDHDADAMKICEMNPGCG